MKMNFNVYIIVVLPIYFLGDGIRAGLENFGGNVGLSLHFGSFRAADLIFFKDLFFLASFWISSFCHLKSDSIQYWKNPPTQEHIFGCISLQFI